MVGTRSGSPTSSAGARHFVATSLTTTSFTRLPAVFLEESGTYWMTTAAKSTSATGGLRAFRAAFGNRYLRRLCTVVAVPMGTFIALATFVQPLLAPAGISESTAGLILAFTMIAGVVGCAILPVWADRSRREVTVMGAGIGFTAVACLHLALVPGTAMAYVTLIGALPIVLALSERHAPDAESTAAGLIWMAGNVGGVVIATTIGLLVTNPATAFLALAGATVLAIPALRWFERLEQSDTGLPADAHDSEIIKDNNTFEVPPTVRGTVAR